MILLLLFVIFLFDSTLACVKSSSAPAMQAMAPDQTSPVSIPIVRVTRMREFVPSRNNCKVKSSFLSSDALKQGKTLLGSSGAEQMMARSFLEPQSCLAAEEFTYTCEFEIIHEVAVDVVVQASGCAVGFNLKVARPRVRLANNVLSGATAYNTIVKRMSVGVYDVQADRMISQIPAFNSLSSSSEFSTKIGQLVNGNGDFFDQEDFTSIQAAFAGQVAGFTQLPSELDGSNPVNKNNIAVVSFSIEQEYKTGAMVKVPCSLNLNSFPLAYQSQCVPFVPSGQPQATPKVWMREYYLFPRQENRCGSSGYTPLARYITSFYDDANCQSSHGYLSFDREFESKTVASEAIVGGWKWTRDFSETRVVYGVPRRFSNLAATDCLGYAQITWVSPSIFQATNVPVERGICAAAPTGAPSRQSQKYKESHASYPIDSGMKCNAMAFQQCSQDVTLLSFANIDARDFNKHFDSTLLTGPRRLFCSDANQEDADVVVFDTLTFRAVYTGEKQAKRSVARLVNMLDSEELGGLVRAHQVPELVRKFNNQNRRKREEEPIIVDPAYAPPPAHALFLIETAAGSSSANSAQPFALFPDKFAVSLALDPAQAAANDEPLTYEAVLATSLPTNACEPGDAGCTCRPSTASSTCNAPLECNSLNYCVPAACPAGDPGCPPTSSGSCSMPSLEVDSGVCVYKAVCAPGSLGCACDVSGGCSSGSCVDNICISAGVDQCVNGAAGCACRAADGGCDAGNCDRLTGMCLFAACAAGTPGCACRADQSCADNALCNANGRCAMPECLAGEPGCACIGQACNKRGFKCVELTRDGSRTMCVADNDFCAESQADRCISECGSGNVLLCGSCSYAKAICKPQKKAETEVVKVTVTGTNGGVDMTATQIVEKPQETTLAQFVFKDADETTVVNLVKSNVEAFVKTVGTSFSAASVNDLIVVTVSSPQSEDEFSENQLETLRTAWRAVLAQKDQAIESHTIYVAEIADITPIPGPTMAISGSMVGLSLSLMMLSMLIQL